MDKRITDLADPKWPNSKVAARKGENSIHKTKSSQVSGIRSTSYLR